MTIRLKIGNTFDLPGTRYSEPFYHYRNFDHRHLTQWWYVGNKIRVETETNKGKEEKESVITFDEYELSFICDVDFAHIIASIKFLDYLLITKDSIDITPEEWESEILDISDNNEAFRKCKITYRLNFSDNKTGENNYATSGQNQVPVASNVRITGKNSIGSTLTGSYVYSDYEGDLEGTSTYRWWRADTATGIGITLIAGETTVTYDITTSDYNKYLFFEVVPVALTGNSPGLGIKSSGFAVVKNSASTAASVAMNSDSGNYTINEEWTGGYTFVDADGDSEGTSIYYWQIADDGSGTNKSLVGNSQTYTPGGAPKIGKYLRFGVKPVAATGINSSTIYWSSWHIINAQTT